MPDEGRTNGIATRGQITHERVGGWDEILIAIRDTLALAVIAALRAAFVVALTLLAGPLSLIVLVPRTIETVARWFEPDGAPMDRYQQAAWGALVALALGVLPDAALIWWPWRWQATRSTWWGLLWPAFWPGAIPAAIVLRAVALVAIVLAWREVWYLRSRLRQEVIAPTFSGATYAQAELHAVRIPGVENPHRDPGAEPEPPVETVRTFRVENVPADPSPARVLAQSAETGEVSLAIGGNGGNGNRRIIEIPVSLLGDDEHAALRRIQAVAYGTLEDERPWSRPEWAGRGALFGPTEWRTLNRWLVQQGLVYKTGPARNDPHEWSRGGRAWLAALLEEG